MTKRTVLKFENLILEKLIKDAKKLDLTGNESYINSYPVFINYFNKLKEIKEADLVIASHFVYAWMPTILTLNTQNIDTVLKFLNKAKSKRQNDLLVEDELECIKHCINNSMVGASKLLHFINPECYAIWDSRIFNYLTNNGQNNYQINKVENYLSYLDRLGEISKHKSYENLRELVTGKVKTIAPSSMSINEKNDFEMTPMRAIEIVMFATDKKAQSEKKNTAKD